MAHAKRRSLRNHHGKPHEHAPGDPLGVYLPPLSEWAKRRLSPTVRDWKHPMMDWHFSVMPHRRGGWIGAVSMAPGKYTGTTHSTRIVPSAEDAYGALKAWYSQQTLVGIASRGTRVSAQNPDWGSVRAKASHYASRAAAGARAAYGRLSPASRRAAPAASDGGVVLYDLHTGEPVTITSPTPAFFAVAEPYSVTIKQARAMLGGADVRSQSAAQIVDAARKHADTDVATRGPAGRVFVRVGGSFHAVAVGSENPAYPVRYSTQNPDWSAMRAKASHYGSRAATGAREAYAWTAPRAKRAAEVTWEGAKSAGRAVKRGAKRAAPVVARGARSAAEGLDRWSQTNGRHWRDGLLFPRETISYGNVPVDRITFGKGNVGEYVWIAQRDSHGHTIERRVPVWKVTPQHVVVETLHSGITVPSVPADGYGYRQLKISRATGKVVNATENLTVPDP